MKRSDKGQEWGVYNQSQKLNTSYSPGGRSRKRGQGFPTSGPGSVPPIPGQSCSSCGPRQTLTHASSAVCGLPPRAAPQSPCVAGSRGSQDTRETPHLEAEERPEERCQLFLQCQGADMGGGIGDETEGWELGSSGRREAGMELREGAAEFSLNRAEAWS